MKRSPKIWRARWLQSQHFWSGVGWLLPCSFMGLVLRFKVDQPGGSLCPLLFLAGFSELAWMQLYVFQNFNPLYLITWNPQTLSWACVAVVQTNWRKKERREGGGEARDWERERMRAGELMRYEEHEAQHWEGKYSGSPRVSYQCPPVCPDKVARRQNKRAPAGMGVFIVFGQRDLFTTRFSCISHLRKFSLCVLTG